MFRTSPAGAPTSFLMVSLHQRLPLVDSQNTDRESAGLPRAINWSPRFAAPDTPRHLVATNGPPTNPS